MQMLLKNAVDLYMKVYLRALSYCVITSTLFCDVYRFGTDISRMSLEIITSLASHVFQSNQSGTILHSHMANFLKVIM